MARCETERDKIYHLTPFFQKSPSEKNRLKRRNPKKGPSNHRVGPPVLAKQQNHPCDVPKPSRRKKTIRIRPGIRKNILTQKLKTAIPRNAIFWDTL
jgi:hypothetical protein